MKRSLPKIEDKKTTSGKALEVSAILLLIFIWIYTIVSFIQLPDRIPIHFNAMGEVDGIGSKVLLFIVPVICTLIYTLFTWLARPGMSINFPVKITEENAEAQYKLAYALMRYVKLAIILLFCFILVAIVNAARVGSTIPGYMIMIAVFGLLVIPIYSFVFRMIRLK